MGTPLSMLLWCPQCSTRHVDIGEFATKPHHTHACQACGNVWRPAVESTVGVQFLPGFKDGDSTPGAEGRRRARRIAEDVLNIAWDATAYGNDPDLWEAPEREALYQRATDAVLSRLNGNADSTATKLDGVRCAKCGADDEIYTNGVGWLCANHVPRDEELPWRSADDWMRLDTSSAGKHPSTNFVDGSQVAWGPLVRGQRIGPAEILEFLDEPNTGLARIEERGFTFVVPCWLLKAHVGIAAGEPNAPRALLVAIRSLIRDDLVECRACDGGRDLTDEEECPDCLVYRGEVDASIEERYERINGLIAEAELYGLELDGDEP